MGNNVQNSDSDSTNEWQRLIYNIDQHKKFGNLIWHKYRDEMQ